MSVRWCAIVFLGLVAACGDGLPKKPEAVRLTEDALGHYCQMEILAHAGPKAQVHLAGLEAPLWFAQVRDAIAYLRMPEQSGKVLAVYVNDMAVARNWNAPGIDNWIDANSAVFVVGSDARGGMGAPELVPFGNLEAAGEFRGLRGGVLMALAEVPDSAVLAPVEITFSGEAGK